MSRTTLRITHSLLAAHRSGALVGVAIGGVSRQTGRRPRGYSLRPRAGATRGATFASATSSPSRRSAVAVVEVRGVLEQRASFWDCSGETDGYDAIEGRFSAAARDPSTCAIVVDLDSVGGDVAAIEQTSARMSALAAQIDLPVLGFANEEALSCGYWLLAATCKNGIYAPPSGRVGAIAACVPYIGDAGALAKEGHEVYVARGLPGKMIPSGIEPLDDLGRARLDRLAVEGTERFIAAIAAMRSIPAETIRSWNAETFTGVRAVEAKLIDGLGSLEETIALAAQLAALKEAA